VAGAFDIEPQAWSRDHFSSGLLDEINRRPAVERAVAERPGEAVDHHDEP